MPTKNSLLRTIRSDFGNVDSQIVYADYLDGQGNETMAEYVRFRANLGPQNDWRPESWDRQRELLDAHPACWEWDNFLALEKISGYEERIRKHSDPDDDSFRQKPEQRWGEVVRDTNVASDEQIEELESLIGRRLPLGYRAYLSEIGNGSAIEQIWKKVGQKNVSTQFQQIFSTTDIVEQLRKSPDQLAAAKLSCELSWGQMIGMHDKSHSVRPATARFSKDGIDGGENRFYVGRMSIGNEDLHKSDADNHDAYEFGTPAGMIQIGQLPYEGEIYLAVEGELSGTIWLTTYGSGDSVISYRETEYCEQMAYLDSGQRGTRATYLPIDTISVICELVLDLVPFGY